MKPTIDLCVHMSHWNLMKCLNTLHNIKEYCTVFEPQIANALGLKNFFEELMREYMVCIS